MDGVILHQEVLAHKCSVLYRFYTCNLSQSVLSEAHCFIISIMVAVQSTVGHTARLQDSLLGLVVGVGSTVTHPPRHTEGSF